MPLTPYHYQHTPQGTERKGRGAGRGGREKERERRGPDEPASTTPPFLPSFQPLTRDSIRPGRNCSLRACLSSQRCEGRWLQGVGQGFAMEGGTEAVGFTRRRWRAFGGHRRARRELRARRAGRRSIPTRGTLSLSSPNMNLNRRAKGRERERERKREREREREKRTNSSGYPSAGSPPTDTSLATYSSSSLAGTKSSPRRSSVICAGADLAMGAKSEPS
jgi:hypothetical protein